MNEKRFDEQPAEGSRSIVEGELQKQKKEREQSGRDPKPAGTREKDAKPGSPSRGGRDAEESG